MFRCTTERFEMRPKILTLSGPSGAGKTTIARNLLDLLPNARMVASNTTRSPRESDIPGEYNYLSPQEFQNLEGNKEFIWTSPPHDGNHYGTLRSSVYEAAKADDSIGIMILTPNVMPVLRSYLSQLCLNTIHIPVFVHAPAEILVDRLIGRGESSNSIKTRLEQSAKWEVECRTSEIPFYFLRNTTSSVDDAVQAVMTQL